MSQEYRIRVVYKLDNPPPRLWVLSPALVSRSESEPIPHVYSGPRPCLFLPLSDEWASDRFIADTFVPWTSLWLYYYEVWHVTGEWVGGGVHPTLKKVKVGS